MNEVRVVGDIDKVQSNLDFYLSVSSIDRKLSIEQYKKNIFEKHFEDAKLHLSEDIDELKSQIKELEERKKQKDEIESKREQDRLFEEKERVRREREERRKRIEEERRKREELLKKERESSVESKEPLKSVDNESSKSVDNSISSESGNKESIFTGSVWDELGLEESEDSSAEEQPVQDRELVSTGRSFLDSVRNKEIKDDKDSDTKENIKEQQGSSIEEVSGQGNTGKQEEKEECEYVQNGLFLEDLVLEDSDEEQGEEDTQEIVSDDEENEFVEESNENTQETTNEEIEYIEHGNFLEDMVEDSDESQVSEESEDYDESLEEPEYYDEDSEENTSWVESVEEDEEASLKLPSIDEEENEVLNQGIFEDSEDVEPEGLFEDEESETVDISERKSDNKIIPMVKKEVSIEDDGMYAQNLPRDVRDFLKLHPNSDMSYVLKFYPKKEIDKQIRLGKIFTRKGKLMI